MIKACDYVASIRPRRPRRATGMLVISFGLIVGYVIAYAASYHQRASAANMAFWYYGERDDVMYPTFYPVYRIHQRVLGAPRHNRDRAPAAETSAGP